VFARKKRVGAERAEGNGECVFRYFVLCYFYAVFIFIFLNFIYLFIFIYFYLFFGFIYLIFHFILLFSPIYTQEVMSCYIRKFPCEIRNQG